MRKSELRQIIREELENVNSDLGEFGKVLQSSEELIEGELYNIYSPKYEEWSFDYKYNGEHSNKDDHIIYLFNPLSLDPQLPYWEFTDVEMQEWIDNGWITKA